MHKHITHINSYDTEIHYYSKKSVNMKNCYNFYSDNLNFRKIENISLSQQTYITNNIIETNTETINYVDDNYLNNDKIATVIVNPTPSLTENYLWILETTDNVVPGLDSSLTYLQSKYATLAALQNSITNLIHTINNEIQNIQTEIILKLLTHRMLVRTYRTIQAILISCINEIPPTTTTEDTLLYKAIIPHINEKVIMSYRSKR